MPAIATDARGPQPDKRKEDNSRIIKPWSLVVGKNKKRLGEESGDLSHN